MKHVLILLLFCSVAYAKSEPPMALLVKAPVEAVKSNTVQLAIAEGYTIDHEGQFQIVFAKNISGRAGLFLLAVPPTIDSVQPRP